MVQTHGTAKVNVKLIVILAASAVALLGGLFVARSVGRRILAARDLRDGNAAYDKQEWAEAIGHYRGYLGRRKDDLQIWKRFAEASLAVRPIESRNVAEAVVAYRRILQAEPGNADACKKLAELYAGSPSRLEDLQYLARNRLEIAPDDLDAPVWLGQALIGLGKHEQAREVLAPFADRLKKDSSQKHPQYLDACALLSRAEIGRGPASSSDSALKWLTDACEYDNTSVSALLRRARFYRETRRLAMSDKKRKDAAVADLAAADELAPSNPHLRLTLCGEWMAHGQLDKAARELEAVKGISDEAIAKYYFDESSWLVEKFLQESELALRHGAGPEDAKLAEDILKTVPEGSYRLGVLPNACRLYVAAGRPADARAVLDEFLKGAKAVGDDRLAKTLLSQATDLEAWVAQAQGRPYRVIDMLEPIAASPNTTGKAAATWGRLAVAYSSTGQTRRAVHAFTQYLARSPRDAEMTLRLAKEYARSQDWDRAFEAAQRAESLDPGNRGAKALRIEAGIHRAVERPDGVDQAALSKLGNDLQALRQAQPKRADIRLLQAIIEMQQNRRDQAEKTLKQAIGECDDDLRVRLQLARFYFYTDRPDQAVEACRQACRKHPGVAAAWLTLSALQVSAKQYPEAIQTLRDGLGAVNDTSQARLLKMRLARVHLLHGLRADGVKELQGIADGDANDTQSRQLLLDLPEIRQDSDQAGKLVAELKAIEGDAGLQWRYYQAAVTLAGRAWRGRQGEVTQLLDKCIESDPTWSEPVLLLVAMHQRLGNLRQAEALCREALKRDGRATDVAVRLVSVLERQEKFAEAQEVVKQLDADAAARRVLSLGVALQAGEYSQAVKELEDRAAADKQDADARVLLARVVYWQNKDAGQALKYLDEADAIAPDSPAAMNARAEIYHAEGRDAEARRILDRRVARAEKIENADEKAKDLFAAHVRRGSFLAATGNKEEAEKDFLALTKLTGYEARGAEALAGFYAGTQRLDQAISILDDAVKSHPDDLQLSYRLMTLLLSRKGEGDEDRAYTILGALEGKVPDHPDLLILHADHLLRDRTGDAEAQARRQLEARRLLERAVQIEPTSVRAHLLLINTAMSRREYTAAARYAVRALGANPNQPLLVLARARAELAQGNSSIAMELARQLLRDRPDSPEAQAVFYEVAATAGNRSLLDEALAMTQEAAADHPDSEATHLSRTRLLLAAGQGRQAAAELEAFCSTPAGSKSTNSFLNLTELYRIRGDAAKAERSLQSAEKLAPNTPAVVQARLRLLGTLREYDEVATLAEKYEKDLSANMGAVASAAGILLDSPDRKHREKAVELLKKVREQAPGSVDVTLRLAGACVKAGKIDEAEGLYKEILNGNPDDPNALNDLAWVLTRNRGKHKEALALAERGLAVAPNSRHLLDTRGEVLSHLPGRLADARADFEKALAMTGEGTREQAKALLQLGRVQAKLNDLPEAKRSLAKAMQIDKRMPVFTQDEREEIAAITSGNTPL